MRLPKIKSLHGVESDAKGTVTFTFTSGDDRKHYVPLEPGVLNAMIGAILSITLERRSLESNAQVQLLTLTAIRPFLVEAGSPCLELDLDNMPVRFALPQGSIPAMIAALTELARLTEKSDAAPEH